MLFPVKILQLKQKLGLSDRQV